MHLVWEHLCWGDGGAGLEHVVIESSRADGVIVWIDEQRSAISRLTPSACTVDAVALYLEGIDGYDDIRKEFLAWRDWGAHGHAFPPGAPRTAADAMEAALAELDAGCPA